jgi:hypothetical protein
MEKDNLNHAIILSIIMLADDPKRPTGTGWWFIMLNSG